ncbi:unnamed protein product, partial [Symbiodinium necroappetens]
MHGSVGFPSLLTGMSRRNTTAPACSFVGFCCPWMTNGTRAPRGSRSAQWSASTCSVSVYGGVLALRVSSIVPALWLEMRHRKSFVRRLYQWHWTFGRMESTAAVMLTDLLAVPMLQNSMRGWGKRSAVASCRCSTKTAKPFEVFLKRLMNWQTLLWSKGPCDSNSWCSFLEPLMATGSVMVSMQQRSFATFCQHPSSVVVVVWIS